MTTCDVDYAAPVVQESINAGKLTVAACIGTDQMGPKRFGPKGELAFSFGNVAQDEGSAMAEFAWKKGWRSASLATDTVIVYFRNVVQAFKARWKQLGGKIVTEETYQSAGGSPASWQSTVTRLNAKQADVIVTATAPPFGAQVPILNGLRTLGNNTPFLNSWAGDGNYWYTPDPKVTNYYYVTFASAFGNDPDQGGQRAAKKNAAAIAKAGSTGAFVTGPAAIDGILVASSARAGTRTALRSRRRWRSSRTCPTLSGLVSFSKSSAHGVRTDVPRDPRPEQHPEGRRDDQGQGRPEDLGLGGVPRGQDAAARSIAPGRRRLARVRGRPGASRRHARPAPARGRRAHRSRTGPASRRS